MKVRSYYSTLRDSRFCGLQFPRSSYPLARTNLTLKPVRQLVLRAVQIIARLHIDPELRRRPEVSTEPERSVGRNPAVTSDDRIDPIARHAQCQRQLIHTEPKRLQEFLAKDLA